MDTPAADRRDTERTRVAAAFAARHRWRRAEIAFWVLAFVAWAALPRQAPIGNEIAILALFAVSLDLILGYGGIVSLGHAAFFGAGCYAAALFAKHFTHEPLAGLVVGAAVAGIVGAATSPLVLRGTDLTRLMVTLGVASILY